LCKSCRTCFMFYCMFYVTCDRSFRFTSLAPVTACLSYDVATQSRVRRRRGEQTRRTRTTAGDQGRSTPGQHRASEPATGAARPVVRRRGGLQDVVLMLLHIAVALGHVWKQTGRRLVQVVVVVVGSGRKVGGTE